MEKDKDWLIVGRILRVVEAEAEADLAAAMDVDAGGAQHAADAGGVAQDDVGAGEEEAQHGAAMDAGAGAEAQLKQIILDVDSEATSEEAALAAQPGYAAAEPDFSITVKAPPRVTFLTTGLGIYPDMFPCVVASGRFCILAAFTDEPFCGPNFNRMPSRSHLVVVRQFRSGADGLIAASAERVPDRGDQAPKLRRIDGVGLLCNDAEHSYTIAELIVYNGSDKAELVIFRSVLRDWSWQLVDSPFLEEDRRREWVPHGTVSINNSVIWYDLARGIITCDLNQQASSRLDFYPLPSGRELEEATVDIHTRRCIMVSEKLVRFLELIVPDGEAAMVCMWSLRRGVGDHGWEWDQNYAVSFQHIWNHDTYIATGLSQNVVPVLACVSPVKHSVVYFCLEKQIFGVDVSNNAVVHCEAYGLVGIPDGPPQHASHRNFIIWNLDPNQNDEEVEVALECRDAICLILARLPTKKLHQLLVVGSEWRSYMSDPVTVRAHLCPVPDFSSRLPFGIIIQPRKVRTGYSHLTISAKIRNFSIRLPLHQKYEAWSEDIGIPCVYGGPETRDMIEFFQKIVPGLDMEFVASYGSLLLARSLTDLFVCVPATGRWIKLPNPDVAPNHESAFGICYTMDSEEVMHGVDFTVVMLVHLRRRRIAALTFSSRSDSWAMEDFGVHGASRCLGQVSPGIHSQDRFYWLSSSRPGRLICYDNGSVRVFREPPVAEDCMERTRRALGSVDGMLRFSATDMHYTILDGKKVLDGEGLFKIWILTAEGSWEQVHQEAIQKDTSGWIEQMDIPLYMKESDCIVDYAGGDPASIMIERVGTFQERYLKSGIRDFIASVDLAVLYSQFDVFPIFM